MDLGCGEGVVASQLVRSLDEPFEYLGLDLNPKAVFVARQLNREHPSLEFRTADILTTEPDPGWADVGLCLEVLEHLPQPRPALQRLMEWTAGTAIVSVPWEPWFRLGNLARGRHLLRLGNHPEHVAQFGPRSFSRLLAQFGEKASVKGCFPWLIGEVETTGAGGTRLHREPLEDA